MGHRFTKTSTAGSKRSLSDNHNQIDLFAEARAMEHHDRIASGKRGHHDPDDLLRTATAVEVRALGWDAGRLEIGALAEFIAIDLDSPRLAGAPLARVVTHAVFAAIASDVTDVVVGGQSAILGRRHILGLGTSAVSSDLRLTPLV